MEWSQVGGHELASDAGCLSLLRHHVNRSVSARRARRADWRCQCASALSFGWAAVGKVVHKTRPGLNSSTASIPSHWQASGGIVVARCRSLPIGCQR